MPPKAKKTKKQIEEEKSNLSLPKPFQKKLKKKREFKKNQRGSAKKKKLKGNRLRKKTGEKKRSN